MSMVSMSMNSQVERDGHELAAVMQQQQQQQQYQQEALQRERQRRRQRERQREHATVAAAPSPQYQRRQPRQQPQQQPQQPARYVAATWADPSLMQDPAPSPMTKQHRNTRIEDRAAWVGSPSSYRHLTYSSTANHHIINHQDVPFELDMHVPTPTDARPWEASR